MQINGCLAILIFNTFLCFMVIIDPVIKRAFTGPLIQWSSGLMSFLVPKGIQKEDFLERCQGTRNSRQLGQKTDAEKKCHRN